LEKKPPSVLQFSCGLSLPAVLWQFQHTCQFTDLVLACSDGAVPAHRAMLAGVFSLLGVEIDDKEVVECLVLPGVCGKQVEQALEELYLENKSEKLLNLLSCKNVKSEMAEAHSIVEVKPEIYSDEELGPDDSDMENSDNFEMKHDLPEFEIQTFQTMKSFPMDQVDLKNPLNAKHPDRPKHIERLKSCTCDQCGYVASTVERLQKHKSCHHDDKHDCPLCDFTTTTKKKLTWHKKVMHTEFVLQEKVKKQDLSHVAKKKEPKVFQCLECGRHLKTKANLQDHMLTHTNEKKFVCPECGKKLKRRQCLTQHMKIHVGEKNYQCDQCEAKYISSAGLRNHIVSKHTDITNAQHFMCSFCGQDFLKKAYLDRHILLHTGEKKYKCDVCPKSFRLETSFRDHMNMHNGIKNHQCPHCGKRFTQRQQMTMHVRRHTGDKRHKCNMCDLAFIEPRSLRNHIKTHQSAF